MTPEIGPAGESAIFDTLKSHVGPIFAKKIFLKVIMYYYFIIINLFNVNDAHKM